MNQISNSGYICGQCRNWIESGTLHTCSSNTSDIVVDGTIRTTYGLADNRLISALERIAAALEKIASR